MFLTAARLRTIKAPHTDRDQRFCGVLFIATDQGHPQVSRYQVGAYPPEIEGSCKARIRVIDESYTHTFTYMYIYICLYVCVL